MRRDHELYLEDIKEAVRKIINFTDGLSFEEFLKDEKCTDAVIRNLEVIGEAAKNIPPEIKNGYPGVEWRKISDLRNLIAHEYFGIDYEIIWDIVQNKLPDLREIIGRKQEG